MPDNPDAQSPTRKARAKPAAPAGPTTVTNRTDVPRYYSTLGKWLDPGQSYRPGQKAEEE